MKSLYLFSFIFLFLFIESHEGIKIKNLSFKNHEKYCERITSIRSRANKKYYLSLGTPYNFNNNIGKHYEVNTNNQKFCVDFANGVIRAHKTDLYLSMTYYPPGAIISVFLEKTDQSKILPTGYTIVYQGIEKNKKYYSITRNSKPGSTINRIIALTYIPTQNDNSYTGGFELYDPLNVNQHWFIKD